MFTQSVLNKEPASIVRQVVPVAVFNTNVTFDVDRSPEGAAALAKLKKVTAQEVALRRTAENQLKVVAAGGAPEDIDYPMARAMAQVAFASRSKIASLSPVDVFSAALAHDLPEDILEWLLHDKVFNEPVMFARLLGHPSCTDKVFFAALQVTLWHVHGATDLKDWAFRHPLVPILNADGHRGQAATLLLSLWADENFEDFTKVLGTLLKGPKATLEVLATLAADFRLGRRTTYYRIGSSELSKLVDQALLVLDPTAS